MKRILVIGDRTSSNWMSARTLPYDIEVAAGSLDAIKRLRQRPFDVLVTSEQTHVEEDLVLLETSLRIRPGLKVVIVAPDPTPPDVIAALRAKAFGCIAAPFQPPEVADMVVAAAEATDWHNGIEVLSARPEWISLRVTSNLLTADRLVSFMDALRQDIPEEERDDLLTAFREMLLNAMEHGAGFDPEKVIDVTAVRTGRAIVYYFHDPGDGFNAAQLEHAAVTNPESDLLAHMEQRAAQGLRPGGFGMLIVRQLVDEVIYNEAGNSVLLIKYM
jgi:anti-sigma regulatory factor (Ser/Thr protein kinase)